MDKNSKIFVAGHLGLVGSAILRKLHAEGYTNCITKTHAELNLEDQAAVSEFFATYKPEYVFLAAAKVGGIYANNKYRADFLFNNLEIQNNVISQSFIHGVKKLLFLGSSCIYPKNAPQPMKEEYLLTGELEYTNEPYAIAKIAGIKLCDSYNIQYNTNFISVMPTNLYGPNDNFDLNNSHVLPAMIRKFCLAKMLELDDYAMIANNLQLTSGFAADVELELKNYGIYKQNDQVVISIWGTGKPFREFLHVDDMADACCFIMQNVNFKDVLPKDETVIRNTHINIGTGKDLTIQKLAQLIAHEVGFQGKIEFDNTKPDGTFRKLQDVSKLNDLGWKYKIELSEGVKMTVTSYMEQYCKNNV